jgi:ATP-dependent helicase/nuclease subunit B
MELFLAEAAATWNAASPERLRVAMERALGEARLRPALANWWRPRLLRIADWIAGEETRRRALIEIAAVATERSGELVLQTPSGPFTLTGRADRIERRTDGTLAIIDYKTGAPPPAQQVIDGHRPQLVLEAAMAALGAFGDEVTGPAGELAYWRLQGGHDPGNLVIIGDGDAALLANLAAQAVEALAALVARFNDPATPYLARPHPGRQLARLGEWGGSGEDAT